MFWFIAVMCFLVTFYMMKKMVDDDKDQQSVMASFTRAVDAKDDDLFVGNSRKPSG